MTHFIDIRPQRLASESRAQYEARRRIGNRALSTHLGGKFHYDDPTIAPEMPMKPLVTAVSGACIEIGRQWLRDRKRNTTTKETP